MNSNKTNFTNNKVRPVSKTLPVKFSTEFIPDVDSCIDIINKLQESGCFNMLSVNVSMKKSICFGNDTAKGIMNVARIQSFNKETNEMNITFFGKNAEYAKLVDNMVIIPHAFVERNTGKVSTIIGFEII